MAAQLYWLLLTAVRPGYADMIDPWRPGWYRAGVVALVLTVLLTWYGLARRRFTPAALWFGGLAWLAVLGVVFAAVTPGGSYLGAIPALAGGLAALAVSSLRPAPRPPTGEPQTRRPTGPQTSDPNDSGATPGTAGAGVEGAPSGGPPAGAASTGAVVALFLAGVVAVAILAPTALLFFPALGLATGGAAAFFVAMLGLALLPVLEWLYPATSGAGGSRRAAQVDGSGSSAAALPVAAMAAESADPWRADPVDGEPPAAPPASTMPAKGIGVRRRVGALPALVCLVIAAGCTVTGLAVDRFDARHPQPSQLMYALDKATGKARWVSDEASPGAWTGKYVSGREDLGTEFPIVGDDVATGPAAVADLPAPTVTVVSDSTDAGRRTLTLDIVSHRQVRLSYFELPASVRVSAATVAGRTLTTGQLPDPFAVLFHGPPGGVLRVTLVVDSTGPLTIRVMDGSDGLSGVPGFTPRPADVSVAGEHTSELLLVADTVTVP